VSASGEKAGTPRLVSSLHRRSSAANDELAALIVASAQGDRQAFRRLYLASAAKLLGIVTRIVKTRAEAEEIVQEVFVSVWTRAASFSPESGSALGWLASIARNRAIDAIRSRASSSAQQTSDIDDYETLASHQDLEAEITDRRALVECLGAVDPMTRDMIMLAYLEGLSREELSARFDCPVATVKTRLHRGLATLKSCLERSDER
jgi:RNA polymerase sigma factor (sigma-70 family)